MLVDPAGPSGVRQSLRPWCTGRAEELAACCSERHEREFRRRKPGKTRAVIDAGDGAQPADGRRDGSPCRFVRAPSHRAAVDLVVEIGKEAGVTTHGPTVLRACVKALQCCDGTEGSIFLRSRYSNARTEPADGATFAKKSRWQHAAPEGPRSGGGCHSERWCPGSARSLCRHDAWIARPYDLFAITRAEPKGMKRGGRTIA